MDLSAYQRAAGWLGSGSAYHFFPRTTSTHDLLRVLAEEGAPEGTLVIADEQTSGRGRLGRSWNALPASALLFSLLFRPPEPFLYFAPRVTMVCALALREAIASVTGLWPALKWPNDLIVSHAASWGKLAGILAESGAAAGTPFFLLVGIGLNVNVPRSHLALLAPQATSLLAEVGRPVDRVAVLDAFLSRAEPAYERLRAGWDPLPAWRQALAWLGASVTVHTSHGEVQGVALDVAESGALLVQRQDTGIVETFAVGDVSLRYGG